MGYTVNSIIVKPDLSERIASSANHLRQLVDQILDLAKMAAGRLEVQWEVIELKAFVLDLTSEIEALLTERSLTLSISVSASLPRVRTDPMHLRQITLNLLGNALKFTSTGGIAVRARVIDVANETNGEGVSTLAPTAPHAGTWIALEVADTGVGIARNDHARIFEEFEQINAGPRTDSNAARNRTWSSDFSPSRASPRWRDHRGK